MQGHQASVNLNESFKYQGDRAVHKTFKEGDVKINEGVSHKLECKQKTENLSLSLSLRAINMILLKQINYMNFNFIINNAVGLLPHQLQYSLLNTLFDVRHATMYHDSNKQTLNLIGQERMYYP